VERDDNLLLNPAEHPEGFMLMNKVMTRRTPLGCGTGIRHPKFLNKRSHQSLNVRLSVPADEKRDVSIESPLCVMAK
jgi:hypothetical protein